MRFLANYSKTRRELHRNTLGIRVQYLDITLPDLQVGEYRGFSYSKRDQCVSLKIKTSKGNIVSRPITEVTPTGESAEWGELVALLGEFQAMERLLAEYDRLKLKIQKCGVRKIEIERSRKEYLQKGRRAELKRLLDIK